MSSSSTTLITGASGFVGLGVLEVLLGSGRRVVGLSMHAIPATVRERLEGLAGEFVDVAGDVRDRALVARVLREHEVRQVLHLAAITASVDRERRDADEIVSVNLAGLTSVLTAAAANGVERFLYAGSIAVFGGGPDGSLLEEDTRHAPRTLYGITKSAAEAIVARLGDLHGLDWRIGRLGRVFGPGEYATGVRDTLSQIYQVTQAALKREPVVLDRPCVKNWSYERDTAAALETLLSAPNHRHHVYNLGSPHVWPLSAWCERLARRLPGFRFTMGEGEGTRIDLGGATDGGLLSWQRFAAEFGPPARYDLDAAFEDYMTSAGADE